MIVRLTRPSVLIIEGIMLFVGINILNSEDSEKLEKSPVFKEQLSNGLLKIVKEKKATDGYEKTTDEPQIPSSTKEKIELVKESYSYDALDALAEGETRKSVLKAIEKQKEILREDRDEKDGE